MCRVKEFSAFCKYFLFAPVYKHFFWRTKNTCICVDVAQVSFYSRKRIISQHYYRLFSLIPSFLFKCHLCLQSSLKAWVNITRSKVTEGDLRRKLYVQLVFLLQLLCQMADCRWLRARRLACRCARPLSLSLCVVVRLCAHLSFCASSQSHCIQTSWQNQKVCLWLLSR